VLTLQLQQCCNLWQLATGGRSGASDATFCSWQSFACSRPEVDRWWFYRDKSSMQFLVKAALRRFNILLLGRRHKYGGSRMNSRGTLLACLAAAFLRVGLLLIVFRLGVCHFYADWSPRV
jgi:hypothetical protein